VGAPRYAAAVAVAEPAGGGAPAPLDPVRTASPTVLRLVIGTQLRRLREARGITREAAGATIRASGAKISRLELGRVSFKERDIMDLLALYGVTDPAEGEAFVQLVRQANTPGWWHRYSDVLPGWFEMYVRLEQAAATIHSYQVQFVPGLFQTEGYARAVIAADAQGEPDEETDRRVALRMTRQKLLSEPEAPHFRAVLDEAALRRIYGSTRVMRDQLEHLAAVADLPNITLQVLPFDRGGAAAAAGPFAMLQFAEDDLPDIVYMEQLTSAVYLDKRAEVELYRMAMDRIAEAALTPAESRAFLADQAAQL
jgi:transcriptional regulator with XRE-family HTH domain